MEITPIGWLLLPLGIVLIAFRPRWLYLLTVFLLPFTATAVINIGEGEHASGVQASLYLGSLLLLRTCLSILRRPYIVLPRAGRSSLISLAMFVAIVALSLVMPIWINGHVQVPSPNLLDTSTQALYLRSSNITGVLYVVLGFGFACVTVAWNRNPAMLRSTLKGFLAGSSFAAAWAILELVCKVSGIPYPTFLNSSATVSARGYREMLEGGIPRLSSVSVEPSIFAQTLLIALALYLPFIFGTNRVFGKMVDRGLFALMFVVLLLTTSSTAYFGVMAGSLLVLFLLVVSGVLRLRHLLVSLGAVVLAGLIYMAIPQVQQVVDSMLLSKGGGYSALERLKTISDSYQMFLRYPLLGIGWTSIVSHDLIVNILANCGILGLAAFVTAMFFILRILCRSIWSRPAALATLMHPDFASFVALAVTLITCIISGFIYMFPFFWFLCGFAVAIGGASPVASTRIFRLEHRG